jgi:Fe-S cluster assembly iron-binding protein IscA
MINVSTRAADKLREELVQRCLDAGIGFRIIVNLDGSGKVMSCMKFDRQRQGDTVVDLGGVKLFSNPTEVAQVKDYHLDYFDNPDGGFFLVKTVPGVKITS